MGLDIVVFKNKKNLDIDEKNNKFFDVDEETGEVFIIDESTFNSNFLEDDFVAISYRIGNLAAVNQLYKSIAIIVQNDNSIVLNKILYNGSHCGDIIKCADFNQLKAEINYIQSKLDDDSFDVKEFVLGMLEVLKVAEEENNPLVFA
jgi:hypothetical protein